MLLTRATLCCASRTFNSEHHLDRNSLVLVAVTSNTEKMEGMKQTLVCGKEGRKKKTSHGSYTVYKTAFSYTNSEHNHVL